jgi:hypothetical protein
MGWCTTFDLDQFAAAAGGYLMSRAAENTLLLSTAQAAETALAAKTARAGWRLPVTAQQPSAPLPGLLFGWWEPPDGGEPRGAFVHDPSVPLLISGRAPEMAAALAATLAKLGRQVCGVDAPTEVADAFAAAWSQRAGTTVRAHRNCRVYRLAGVPQGTPLPATPAHGTLSRATPPQGMPAVGTGGWPSAEIPGPAGRLRVAAAEDQALLADWLTAFATEFAERISSASELAADLISYGGAVFWEVPGKPSRFRDAAHYLPIPHHRDLSQLAESGHQPMALATLTRPVAGIVRISMLYTMPERRHNGYATALTLAVSRAVLTDAGPPGPGGAAPDCAQGVLGALSRHVNEVVMITDKSRPDRWSGRFGYQLVGERAVLRFGPVTGPLPRTQPSGAMPRLPTGPLPRLPRLRR